MNEMNDMSETGDITGDLQRLFEFILFTARLREVERPNNATPHRRESGAEHSWHLAMVSWVLHAAFEREAGITIDLGKLLKLCLMHDLVEIDRTGARQDGEETAYARFTTLPGALGPEFVGLWHEYEEGDSPEACLVRGVDRLNPALMRYVTGQGWHDVPTETATPLDADALDRLQLPRLAVSPTLRALYEEVRDAAVRQDLLTPTLGSAAPRTAPRTEPKAAPQAAPEEPRTS